MRVFATYRISLLLGAWLALLPVAMAGAAQPAASGFGEVAIPQPQRPAQAENCVEPVEVMRREHMTLLHRQRDRTVIDGERDGKHSLVGCMNCHNPVTAGGEAPAYGDPDHFCSACHAWTSVDIDCFECHADRGYGAPENGISASPWDDGTALTAATARRRLEIDGGD
jgi:hypothetical protein